MLVCICGCPPDGTPWIRESTEPVEPAANLARVVGRVNENAAAMNFVLEAQGDAHARHIGANGKPEPFDGRAKLLFRKPRDLYMKLDHTLDEIMQIGSNSTEFWVWKKINEDRYWWGRHDQMTPEAAADLPIRPEEVVEVMGFGHLPDRPDPTRGPLLEVLPQRYLLTFLAAQADGTPYVTKRLWIDRRAPFLLREMEYLTPAGRISTRAEVGDYQPVPGTGAQVPRRVWLKWPGRDEYLQMVFDTLQRYDRDPTRAFTSPRQQGVSVGDQIRVDRPFRPASQPEATSTK